MRRMGLWTRFRGGWPGKQGMRDLLSSDWNKDLFIFPGEVRRQYQCTSKINALIFFLDLN